MWTAGTTRSAAAGASAAAAAGRSAACCNKQGDFQPRLLTKRLQQAQHLQELQQLWQRHGGHFNSIHFSALMHQLSVLHSAAGALNARTAAADKKQARAQRTREQTHPQGGQQLAAVIGSAMSVEQQQQQQQVDEEEEDGESEASHQEWSHHQSETPAWLMQQLDALAGQPQQQQQQQHDQRQQQDNQQQIERLAAAVAAASLQPGVVQQLDGRALVMTLHSLARLGVHDRQLVAALLQAAGQQLQQLDAHQITNLIWAAAVHTGATRPDGQASPPPSPQQQLLQGGAAARAVLPEPWLAEATEVLRQRLPECGGPGVAMALWGLAHLGYRPPPAWWCDFFGSTQQLLSCLSSQELAVVIYCCGRLRPAVPRPWLQAYLTASSAALPGMNSQALTMSVWGLAAAGLAPDKAWLMAWFLTSRTTMQRSCTQDLSLWLYSLAVLRLTPSPVWCTSFVEASFAGLTAPTTRPQELVNVMWAIGRMTWSPPVLYWQGLMQAAKSSFRRCNPQDLSTCISAVVSVDVSGVDKGWLQAFIQASQPRLAAFQPVQLANTGLGLASISRAHAWAPLCIPAAWLAAYVAAAAAHLGSGRFSARNLQLVIRATRSLSFLPAPPHVTAFLQQAEAQLQGMRKQQQQLEQQPSQPAPAMLPDRH